MTERVVVVGGGLAAAKVVETLRKEGYEGGIALVGEERHRPYERPGLSKDVLQGRAEVDSLFVHEPGFYEASGIEIRLGDAATVIDRTQHTLALASGETLPYDALVLATGARPRTVDLPGAGLPGVHTLRTIEDGLALRDEFHHGRRIVIVGGGWIGLEAAAAASGAGCSVTILERAELPLLPIMGERVARHFADLHRSHGVDLRTGVGVDGFEGDGRVRAVRSGGVELPADAVLVGVGAIPNTALAEQAGLAVDNGVLADDRLVTDDPAILAVGDVVNAHNATLGRRLRVEHWDNARRQGRLAALSILGRPNRYDWQPYFYTDQYDLSMEYVGHGSPDADVVLRGRPEAGPFLAFWLEDGRLTAAMNVNTPKTNAALRRLIGREVDAARLADPDVPLDALAEG